MRKKYSKYFLKQLVYARKKKTTIKEDSETREREQPVAARKQIIKKPRKKETYISKIQKKI